MSQRKTDLLKVTDSGLYCAAGDFFIDPWRPVDKAIITHGHSDHASFGHHNYLCSPSSEAILRARLGDEINTQTLPFREELSLNGVTISLHPAGHILGSAQVRVEHKGEVWCVSGDYKTEPDITTEAFEPVKCHTFITETTFGLPIYKWKPEREVFLEINAWWAANQQAGRASLLMGYSLGKAQRMLASLDPELGPIFVHGSVRSINQAYEKSGVYFPPARHPSQMDSKFDFSTSIIVAPPSVQGTPWTRRFGNVSTAFASGWMMIRGARRRKAADRGFVLSDHVDWPSLMTAIKETGAERILTTHGYADEVSRYLRDQGYDSQALATRFVGESIDAPAESETTEEGGDLA